MAFGEITGNLSNDRSAPAQKRDARRSSFRNDTPHPVRHDRTPDVDWTGIRFKAVQDLGPVDPNHRGRETK